MRVAILGRTHWLLSAAERLVADGHIITLVATAAAAPEYRAKEADFMRFARSCGAPFYCDVDANDGAFIATLRASDPEIGVSVNWPSLLREEICAALPHGILNAHAGDLPRYRGNACPNWAILSGEDEVGLCVHAMSPTAVDAGPVYVRDRLRLSDTTYIGDVYNWIADTIPVSFARAVALASDPGFVPEEQAASGVRPLRTFPRRPEDGLIDWGADASIVMRLIRASSRPFAGAYTYFEGEERVTIWRARSVTLDHDIRAVPGQIIGRGPGNGPMISCGAGVVEIEEGERETGKPIPAANRYRLGPPRR